MDYGSKRKSDCAISVSQLASFNAKPKFFSTAENATDKPTAAEIHWLQSR